MSALRAKFVEAFDNDVATAIELAAEDHKNGIHDEPGSDYFRWALVITIGFECWSKDTYAKHHGIEADADSIRQWIKDHADLGSHDGDVDYLALMAGAYDEYASMTEVKS